MLYSIGTSDLAAAAAAARAGKAKAAAVASTTLSLQLQRKEAERERREKRGWVSKGNTHNTYTHVRTSTHTLLEKEKREKVFHELIQLHL